MWEKECKFGELPAADVSNNLDLSQFSLFHAEWWIHISSNWNPCTKIAYKNIVTSQPTLSTRVLKFHRKNDEVIKSIHQQSCHDITCSVSNAILKGSNNNKRNIDKPRVLYITTHSLILQAPNKIIRGILSNTDLCNNKGHSK